MFVKKMFRMKTNERAEPFTLTVQAYKGIKNGQQMFNCVYHTRLMEEEDFSKENILACLLDDSAKKEVLQSTDAGAR